ncbi:ABC transporter ATP-binding protein [Streptomyces sp. TP-A0874]|uniref:ABC transporter ATP-binding protein n=1 Tax=Streptomyces sp. TP-A0874 TaxID=549819 RepID=UPI0009A09638|nr:ABC transporter ATP-binding protein [Streptomyces sp. TP-A0874]
MNASTPAEAPGVTGDPHAASGENRPQGTLTVRDLAKTYGTGPAAVHAIDSLSFDVRPGEFVCIVGPSGVGKSTLLKCLSGLLAPTSGEARLDGRPIAGRPPEGLSFVFQDYTRSLFPWFPLRKNVALPLRNKGVSRAEADQRAQEALAAVGLGDRTGRYPWQLSGGMQQRVAIARGLAYEPELLLMDEPFASVDAQTRAELEDLTLEVQRRFGITVLLVTHDIDEAIYLADRVVVLGGPPCVLQEVVEVDLPRPRDQIATKSLARFAELRGHVTRLIKGE